MNDTITVQDLAVLYHVGVPDEERAKPQRLILSIAMEKNFTAAARADEISQTIDYYALTQRLLTFGQGRNWKLIEKLAVDIAEMILQDFGPDAVSVEVKKLIIPEARWVSVKLRRAR